MLRQVDSEYSLHITFAPLTRVRFSATLEARCHQLESLVEQMTSLMGRFQDSFQSLDEIRQLTATQNFALPHPGIQQFEQDQIIEQQPLNSRLPQLIGEDSMQAADHQPSDGQDDSQPEIGDDASFQSIEAPKDAIDHVMTVDSYGKLRCVIIHNE